MLLGFENAEQEGGDNGVEGIVGESCFHDVPLEQFRLQPQPPAAFLGPAQHGPAQVDAAYPGVPGVEGHVASGADAGIEDAAPEAGP